MTDTTRRDGGIQKMIVSLFDNDNRQHVRHAGFLFGQAGLSILTWWFFSDHPLPETGPLLSFIMDIGVRILPLFAVICVVLGIVQMGWYARLCWNTKPPSRMGGES